MNKKGDVAVEYYLISGLMVMISLLSILFSLVGQAGLQNAGIYEAEEINFVSGFKEFVRSQTFGLDGFPKLLWYTFFTSPIYVILGLIIFNKVRGRG